jgi:hypothetical protein
VGDLRDPSGNAAVVEWFPGFAFCRTSIWNVGRSFKFSIRHRSAAP